MPIPSTSPAFGDADIPALLADTGIAVNIGGVGGIALLDEADQIIVQDSERAGVVMLATTLTIQTSAFPLVKIGDPVVAGNKNFTVRERLREGDGGLTKIILGSGPVPPPLPPAAPNVIDGGTF